MNEAEFSPEVAKEHVEAALADPALASLRLAGAPVLVISGAPGRVVYASAAAQSLFVGDLPALARRLLLGAEPGARRIVALSRSLLPGAAPRLGPDAGAGRRSGRTDAIGAVDTGADVAGRRVPDAA